MSKSKENLSGVSETSIPTPTEESNTLGEIKINHSVVASIVRLAALEVPGVLSVGGGFVDGIAEIFSKKDSDRGVRVESDEVGDYKIEIRVILRFGLELAKVAFQVQQNIADQVSKMTSKQASKIDVIIDGVRIVDESTSDDEWEGPEHTD